MFFVSFACKGIQLRLFLDTDLVYALVSVRKKRLVDTDVDTDVCVAWRCML
jgi:hypothetical protein